MSGVRKSERGESRLEAQHLAYKIRKLVKRINPESVTRERHRLKAYKRLLACGRMNEEEIENAFKSWMVLNYKVMSRMQIQGIYEVYKELFGKEITWKISRLRYLTAQSSQA